MTTLARRKTLAALALAAALTSASASACRRGQDLPRPEPTFPIVVILVDALRADRVSTDEAGRRLAPNTAALAGDGVLFRRAFASAPKTVPSVPQLFTSRYFPDTDHGVTLLSTCRDAGYGVSAGFVHNPYVTKWLGRIEPTFDHMGGGAYGAQRLTDRVLDWLGARPADSFLLYVHYLDVHAPFQPPREFAERFVDPDYRGPVGLEFTDIAGAMAGGYDAADRRRIEQLYDATIAETDHEVGRVLDALRAAGLYEKSLVVLTSDHGEELWERGSFFHGHSLFDELLHVPLLVKFPGNWAAGRQVDDLVRTIDVLPTVQDLLRRAGSPLAVDEGADGRSLVPVVVGGDAPRTLFATVGRVDHRSPPLHAVRTIDAKLVHDARSGAEAFFDLRSDPGELRDRSQDPAVASRMEELRASLRERLAAMEAGGIHLRLRNGSAQPVDYEVDLTTRPVAPFVNIARVALEDGDRIEQKARADGLVLRGTLAPGEADGVRFEVLSSEGSVVVTVSTGGAPASTLSVCVGDEAPCRAVAAGTVEAPLEDLVTGQAPEEVPGGEDGEAVSGKPGADPGEEAGEVPGEEGTAGLELRLWRVPGASDPIVPKLSAADRERLRALGYAE